MNRPRPLESSHFQRDSAEYYGLLREIHSGVYASKANKDAELRESRYQAEDPPALRSVLPLNLNTWLEMLHDRCGGGASISGIDFGCGSHWFIDHVRSQFGWSAVGYDPDLLAIEIAKARYPDNAESYRHRNVLRDGLPEADESQFFVFSNAVLQHFDDAECDRAIGEMARVLHPNGHCLLIFKRWTSGLADGTDQLSPAVRIIDASAGSVLLEDPTMKRELSKLDPARLSGLEKNLREGWRLLHLLRVEQILSAAKGYGLHVVPNLSVGEHHSVQGVLKYLSGKGIPTAAVFFAKPGSHEDHRSHR